MEENKVTSNQQLRERSINLALIIRMYEKQSEWEEAIFRELREVRDQQIIRATDLAYRSALSLSQDQEVADGVREFLDLNLRKGSQ